MCACGKSKKTDAVTSVQTAAAMVAAASATGQPDPDEIPQINRVREQRSVNNAVANSSS